MPVWGHCLLDSQQDCKRGHCPLYSQQDCKREHHLCTVGRIATGTSPPAEPAGLQEGTLPFAQPAELQTSCNMDTWAPCSHASDFPPFSLPGSPVSIAPWVEAPFSCWGAKVWPRVRGGQRGGACSDMRILRATISRLACFADLWVTGLLAGKQRQWGPLFAFRWRWQVMDTDVTPSGVLWPSSFEQYLNHNWRS